MSHYSNIEEGRAIYRMVLNIIIILKFQDLIQVNSNLRGLSIAKLASRENTQKVVFIYKINF